MYNAFFELKDSPFRLTPDTAYLYMTVQHREVLSGLVHSVCNHSGLTAVVGEAGTGKTTLIQVLKTWLSKLNFVIASCTNPILTAEELYDLLLTDLAVPCTSSLKNRRLAALQETLERYRAEQRRAVLIVDEAHRLSPELLEEIRLLLNLETPKEKLLEIIIAGQPELGDMLRTPELRQLKQRVSSFCRLHPLTVTELREYIHHRLSRAGRTDHTLFPDDTIELIHEYTGGIPRLVNNLCDSALRIAFALESPRVTRSILGEAAEDLDLDGRPLKSLEPKHEELVELRPSALDRKATAVPTNGREHAPVLSPTSSNSMPLESYAHRQKSLNFIVGLLDRWK